MKKSEIKNYNFEISKSVLEFSMHPNIIIKNYLLDSIKLDYDEDFFNWYDYHVINMVRDINYRTEGCNFYFKVKIIPDDIWNDLELVEERLKVGL